MLGVDLAVSDNLVALLVVRSLGHDLVPADGREDFCPEGPVDAAQNEHTDTNDGEDVVGVAVGSPRAGGRDERDEGQEDVDENVKDRDGEVSVPRRGPVLLLVPLEIEKTAVTKMVSYRL